MPTTHPRRLNNENTYHLSTLNDVMTEKLTELNNSFLTQIEDNTTINSNLTEIKNVELKNEGKSEIHIDNGAIVWADSVPVLVEDSNKRQGWYYTNPVAGNKMNLYFFNGDEETYTLGELDYLYAKMSVDTWSNNDQNLPFLTIYTKPTGVNDAGAFYHSRINYTMTSTTPKIGLGEECYFFGKSVVADNDKWFQNRAIEMVDENKLGECLDTEEILFLVVQTDSGADAGKVAILVQELGFSFNSGENVRKTILLADKKVQSVMRDENGNSINVVNGILETGVRNTWDTETILASTPLASGASLTTNALELDNIITHGYNEALFFVSNSASLSIDIEPETSPDNSNWYSSGGGILFNTKLNKSYFCQTECFKLGHTRYMRLKITNKDVSSTNIEVQTGRYK